LQNSTDFKLSGVKGQGQPIRDKNTSGPIKDVHIVFGVDL